MTRLGQAKGLMPTAQICPQSLPVDQLRLFISLPISPPTATSGQPLSKTVSRVVLSKYPQKFRTYTENSYFKDSDGVCVAEDSG